MRTRALRQNNIRQVKCNLCQEWMMTHNLIKNTLNSCSLCLQKYAEGADIWNQKGQKIKMIFVKDHQAGSQSFLKNGQATQDLTQPTRVKPLNLSNLQQMMQSSQLSAEQKQILDSRIQYFAKECEQEAQNICQLIRRISNRKSQSYLHFQPYERSLSKYKSQIFESYINYSEIKPKKKDIDYHTLEDYCQNLNQTRYIKAGYEFYFDSEQIQKYASLNNTKKIQKYSSLHNTKNLTRVFGTELSSNFSNQQNLFLDLGRRLENKSNRSFINIQPISARDLRMTEETLKLKIFSCLQSKYPSSSLYKILSMNTKEAYVRTKIFPKMIQLISFKISSIDLGCYLNLFESENMQTIKLVNVQLNNNHLAIILDNIWNKKVQRLVLSCNRLTDGCLPLFLNKSLPFLKQIYLGKNRINKYRMKQNIVELRSKFVIYI